MGQSKTWALKLQTIGVLKTKKITFCETANRKTKVAGVSLFEGHGEICGYFLATEMKITFGFSMIDDCFVGAMTTAAYIILISHHLSAKDRWINHNTTFKLFLIIRILFMTLHEIVVKFNDE